jgi:hypothetical protein
MGWISLVLIVAAGGALWFCWPAISDVIQLQRHNARISALTKQTKRDMDNLARRQRKSRW